MNPVSTRLKAFAKKQGLSVRAFERSCGLTEGYISAIRQSISKKKLDAITARYPELNPSWILFGEGEMLKMESSPDITLSREVWEEFRKMNATILEQQQTILILLNNAGIEGLTVAKSSPNEGKTE